MIRSRHKYILSSIIIGLLLFIPSDSLQQGFVHSPVSTLKIVEAGLSIGKDFVRDGDAENARYAAEFASSNLALNLQGLREHDSSATGELHISLLDLPASIEPGSTQEFDSVLSQLEVYDIQVEDSDLVVVDMLSAAYEEYVVAIDEENDAAYEIARTLFSESKTLFEEGADLNVMLDLEQQSFFNDLEEGVENRMGFVPVGNIVSAIQRDLLGTQTEGHDQQKLYENIRVLYAKLLEAVDAGDYDAAEELAIEAYLENFEYLEPTLEIINAEFMYALEIDMREDLRGMIKDGQSPGQIREFLEGSILPDLNRGEEMTVAFLATTDPSALSPERTLKERGDSTDEQQAEVRTEIDFIRSSLQEMLIHYENGDYASAYTTSRTAYLDSYEYVEIPLRPIAPDFTLEVEYQFAELRNLIKEQAPYEEVQKVSIAIDRNLDESERLVTGSGQIAPFIAFTASFAIIFREGLESVLILGAILTYLEASRSTRFKTHVYYGILLGIVATAITWFVASFIIEISGANRELIEAIAALSATAVLFYVSFWILNKIEHKKWMEFVKAKVWQATTTGSATVFILLSFFTIYREGFETVLFYQAMFGFAKYLELYVGLGFILGIGSLLVIYFVMRRLGRRLPLRALFGLTMGIGAYLSIAFLGNAVRELQVLDLVPYTSMIGTVPRLDINLATMTGIYPTLETVVAQIVLLAVYLVASSYVLILRPKKAAKLESMRKSRKDEFDIEGH